MKKCLFFLIILLIVFLAGCGAKGKTPVVSEGERYYYTVEKLFSGEVVFDNVKQSWNAGTHMYMIGTKEDQPYEFWQYDWESLSTSKIFLSLGDLRPCNSVDGYVDDENMLHILCRSANREPSAAIEYVLCTFDPEGRMTDQKSLTQAISQIVKKYSGNWDMSVLPNGKLLFFSMDKKKVTRMILMSDDGTIELTKNFGKTRIWSSRIRENDLLLAIEINPENNTYSISEINLGNGERNILVENLSGEYNYGFAYGCDTQAIYYQTEESLWEYQEKEHKLSRMLSFQDSSLKGNETGYAVQRTDGSWCMLYGGDGSLDFIRLVKTEEKVTAKSKIELTYAVVGPKQLFLNDVNTFHYSQDKIKINIKEYEDIDPLLVDIVAGNVPDLVDIGNEDVYLALEKQHLLEDLGAYLQQDEKLSRADFLPKALEIYENGGKLYAIPYGVILSAMMGDSSYLGDRKGWDMQQFREFLESAPNRKLTTGGCFNQEILVKLCYQYLDHFVDEAQTSCNFQTEEFLKFLEISALFADYDESEEALNQTLRNLLSGECVLTCVQIGDFNTYEYWRTFFPNKGRIIGFPSDHGSGVGIQSGGIAPAITKNCKQKEAAWEFIKYTSTREKENHQMSLFPSYQPLLNKMVNEAKKNADSKESLAQISFGNSEIDIPHASLSEIEALQELLYSGEAVKGGDEKIIEIICEEAQAYFAGSQSAEKVAETIQNRVSLYLSE